MVWSEYGVIHPPRSNPPLRSSSAPPSPCITPSVVTIVVVVSFMISLLSRLLRPLADVGRPLEHGGEVLEQVEPTVERAALDQVEGDVGIPVEDAFLPGGTRDDRE